MKVCVVTVYDSINSGSFLQAYALGKTLEKFGHEVVYMERPKDKNASSSRYNQIKRIVSLFLKGRFSDAIHYYFSIKKFRKTGRVFKIIKNKPKDIDDMDFFVLGSDTIWNLKSEHFRNNRKLYWGSMFKGKSIVTYAASAANTSVAECKNYQDLGSAVALWKNISVRDLHTHDIVASMTDKKISIVLDPTFLIKKEEYRKIIKPIKDKHYIFVYIFNELSTEQIRGIEDLSQKNGCKIICGTSKSIAPFCDRTIINSPDMFLSYMANADYIVTDTFHGSVFSIIFEKNFIAIDRNKLKVNELLDKFSLSERLIDETKNIIDIFNTPIDYKMVNCLKNDLINDSVKFLANALLH